MKRPLALIPAEEARRRLAEAVGPVEVEEVTLAAAAGRVLAAPFVAPEPAPGFPRALMDGYAVRAADVAGSCPERPVILRLVGSVPMGAAPSCAVGAGEAAAIATGGHLPPGADAVVMIEQTELTAAQSVAIRLAVASGRNVVAVGEDVAAGQPLLAPGRRLCPIDVGALAAFGVTTVAVRRRPRVALLSTGTELCAAGTAPGPGQVRDLNQPMLTARLAGLGAQVTPAGIVADEPGALAAAVAALLPAHDLVVLSGGSSVGGKDFTGEVLAGLHDAELLFHGIDVRPGKPTIAARAGGRLVLGLPGVPAAAAVIFRVFGEPLVQALAGEEERPRPRRARLTAAYQSTPGREDYLRVRLVERGDELWAEPLVGGPAALSSLLAADGIVVVPAAAVSVPVGEVLPVLLF